MLLAVIDFNMHVANLGLYEWFEKWADKPVRNRGEDYLEFKDKLTSHLLDILHEFVPQVKGRIEHYHLGTREWTTSFISCTTLSLVEVLIIFSSIQMLQLSVRLLSWRHTRRVATEHNARLICSPQSIDLGRQHHSPKSQVFSWQVVMHSCPRSLGPCTEGVSVRVLYLVKLEHCG